MKRKLLNTLLVAIITSSMALFGCLEPINESALLPSQNNSVEESEEVRTEENVATDGTIPNTEVVTEPITEPSIEVPTNTPTETVTKAPTEPQTQPPTETTPAQTDPTTQKPTEPPTEKKEAEIGNYPNGFSMAAVPSYNGSPYAVINGNTPFFTDSEITDQSYEYYSELDSLGRCYVTMACIGKDLMPTGERGEIGHIKPTGWHTVKYDCVDGKYLYNRCHLIGFQLTGENDNVSNLITGTRYMNVDGMLPFENMVDDYIEETNNHILYRVTPIFEGNNLVATGVLMEAMSVEDNGEGILFCVFCYNVQPGVVIDYATGESWLATEEEIVVPDGTTYILNNNTKKFHYESCGSAEKISDKNRGTYTGSRDELINMGFSPCRNCDP